MGKAGVEVKAKLEAIESAVNEYNRGNPSEKQWSLNELVTELEKDANKQNIPDALAKLIVNKLTSNDEAAADVTPAGAVISTPVANLKAITQIDDLIAKSQSNINKLNSP